MDDDMLHMTTEEMNALPDEKAAELFTVLVEQDVSRLAMAIDERFRWSAPRAAMACIAMAARIIAAAGMGDKDKESLLWWMERLREVAAREP